MRNYRSVHCTEGIAFLPYMTVLTAHLGGFQPFYIIHGISRGLSTDCSLNNHQEIWRQSMLSLYIAEVVIEVTLKSINQFVTVTDGRRDC